MGFWINIVSGYYSSGPRHYCDLPPVRSSPVPVRPERLYFAEYAGPTLCGKSLQATAQMAAASSKQHSKSGGLSAVLIVNLLQTNLCGPCVRAYLSTRPALAAAVEAARHIRVDSI